MLIDRTMHRLFGGWAQRAVPRAIEAGEDDMLRRQGLDPAAGRRDQHAVVPPHADVAGGAHVHAAPLQLGIDLDDGGADRCLAHAALLWSAAAWSSMSKIGRASCRERVQIAASAGSS